jgi:catechol 2,3-dioxygenase-like lactoylglutathione lyase family enzyme
MITGGIATIMVSDFDRAIEFYTRTLGLKLSSRFGNDWAEIDGGGGLRIGLHPEGHGPKAGTQGAISIGFNIQGAIEGVVASLKEKGVAFRGPILDNSKTEGIKLAMFGDPDGNPLYLCEVVKSW